MAADGPAAEARKSADQFAIVARTALISAVLLAGKWLVHEAGLEIIVTLPVFTALMGGVVFTLAIMLAGTLADFKESERIVGELASELRRIFYELRVIALNEGALRQMREHLRDIVRVMNANFRREVEWDQAAVGKPIAALDDDVAKAAAGGAPTSPLRTVQVRLGNAARIVERIEVIIETTFLRPGYYFAGATVAAALFGFMFAAIDPFLQAMLLFAFGSFLLIGLFLLIWDLDNPFAGAARVSTAQMRELEAFLDRELGAA